MRTATYRVQLTADAGFDHAAGLAPYLTRLGISDLYCSPMLQAAPGSTHGYDVVDHSVVSEDLGGERALTRLVEALRGQAMGLTVDIVPNHMATDGRRNRWWWDVLENGPSSLYAAYFDIDWPRDAGRDDQTVLAPILGDRYGKILDRGEVAIRREGGAFTVTYFDHELPVSPRTLDVIMARAASAAGSDELAEVAAELGALPHAAATDSTSVRVRHERKEELRDRLAALCESRPELAAAVDAEAARISSDPDELDRLLVRQNFRLSYWRVAREELDYRRFFNIETLVALRTEDDQVFADTHETIGRLVKDGTVDGLRVDHVDGLRDPEGYLQRLRRLAPVAYIAVEKILGPEERLPESWPVDGTTGYDFIARISNLFVDASGEEPLTRTYGALTGQHASYEEVVQAAKDQIMAEELAPEVDRLTRLMHGICESHRRERDRTTGEVRDALRAMLAAFPVYRTYLSPGRACRDEDVETVGRTVADAKAHNPEVDPELLDFIGQVLVLEWPGAAETEMAERFPQVSSPVVAKGAEDTAFYRYNRLVALNEVGGDPGVFGRPLARFHADTEASARWGPRSMLALATHDTKRSPDVRARIGLLSEIPGPWEEAVSSWFDITQAHAGSRGPAHNDRYLLFQTLVGAWPIGADRLWAYMEKAAREAKVHTSWADPDEEYEQSLRKFVEGILSDERFVAALELFLARHRVVELGRATGLSMQTLLLTCPGVPDIYQGTETWDLSLVDPDNRRPVDFADLAAGLDEVAVPEGRWPVDALAGEPAGAARSRAKLWLTHTLLSHRRSRPDAYEEATYRPLTVRGPASEHLVAFSRGGVAVLAARHLAALAAPGQGWSETTVELPPGGWRPVIGRGGTGAGAPRSGDSPLVGALAAADALGAGPVAVLERAER